MNKFQCSVAFKSGFTTHIDISRHGYTVLANRYTLNVTKLANICGREEVFLLDNIIFKKRAIFYKMKKINGS